MSFVTHVFEPSLTFFPGNVGVEEDKETGRDEIEGSEADVCAQLVSVVFVSRESICVVG